MLGTVPHSQSPNDHLSQLGWVLRSFDINVNERGRLFFWLNSLGSHRIQHIHNHWSTAQEDQSKKNVTSGNQKIFHDTQITGIYKNRQVTGDKDLLTQRMF